MGREGFYGYRRVLSVFAPTRAFRIVLAPRGLTTVRSGSGTSIGPNQNP